MEYVETNVGTLRAGDIPLVTTESLLSPCLRAVLFFMPLVVLLYIIYYSARGGDSRVFAPTDGTVAADSIWIYSDRDFEIRHVIIAADRLYDIDMKFNAFVTPIAIAKGFAYVIDVGKILHIKSITVLSSAVYGYELNVDLLLDDKAVKKRKLLVNGHETLIKFGTWHINVDTPYHLDYSRRTENVLRSEDRLKKLLYNIQIG